MLPSCRGDFRIIIALKSVDHQFQYELALHAITTGE
jgi:hypothetical protein